MDPQQNPTPGWYPDPTGLPQYCYWTGTEWGQPPDPPPGRDPDPAAIPQHLHWHGAGQPPDQIAKATGGRTLVKISGGVIAIVAVVLTCLLSASRGDDGLGALAVFATIVLVPIGAFALLVLIFGLITWWVQAARDQRSR